MPPAPVIGVQSGRTSAPMRPQAVQTMRDSCYGGAFVENRPFGSIPYTPKAPGAHAIAAGGSQEQTWHVERFGTGSVFFESLFQALDGQAGKHGVVTFYELAGYLHRQIQTVSNFKQNPEIGHLRIGSPGSFFFFNRSPLVANRTLAPWDGKSGVPFGTPYLPQASTSSGSAVGGALGSSLGSGDGGGGGFIVPEKGRTTTPVAPKGKTTTSREPIESYTEKLLPLPPKRKTTTSREPIESYTEKLLPEPIESHTEKLLPLPPKGKTTTPGSRQNK